MHSAAAVHHPSAGTPIRVVTVPTAHVVRDLWSKVPPIRLTPDELEPPDMARVLRFPTLPKITDRLGAQDRRDLADHLGLDDRDGVWGDDDGDDA